jgi:hypothetical protein
MISKIVSGGLKAVAWGLAAPGFARGFRHYPATWRAAPELTDG